MRVVGSQPRALLFPGAARKRALAPSGQAGNRIRIDPAPKHADIASQVSTYREQVTREFSALAKQGLLEKDGTAIVLTDVERLERIVTEVRLEA